jgi:hypothetical protein
MFTDLSNKYLNSTRALIVLLMLVFMLGSLAHAGHNHEKQQSQHQTCEYCIGYAHLGGSTPSTNLLPVVCFTDEAPAKFEWIAPTQRPVSNAQARAPPIA